MMTHFHSNKKSGYTFKFSEKGTFFMGEKIFSESRKYFIFPEKFSGFLFWSSRTMFFLSGMHCLLFSHSTPSAWGNKCIPTTVQIQSWTQIQLLLARDWILFTEFAVKISISKTLIRLWPAISTFHFKWYYKSFYAHQNVGKKDSRCSNLSSSALTLALATLFIGGKRTQHSLQTNNQSNNKQRELCDKVKDVLQDVC